MNIIEKFSKIFHSDPAFRIQVPGRVNLIGEHIDYNGFPVLPISIPQTIMVAGAARADREIHCYNTNDSFPASTFELSHSITQSSPGNWINYIKAAAQSLVPLLGKNPHGLNVLFHGSIPRSAGLSSSSALVIASALSLLAANDLNMDSLELAELMAEGERYVGTQGGGMDQAICLLGKKQNAVKIDFFPLKHSFVPFPGEFSIVVAHSLIRASKTENALIEYNRRPAECRLAVAILNSVLFPDTPIKRLGDIRAVNWSATQGIPGERFINKVFLQDSYTLDEISKITNKTIDQITQKYLLMRNGNPMPVPPEGFLIRTRVLHVFTEAQRVEDSCTTLFNNDLKTFGTLMNESHKSCDINYGLSTPELNTLVEIMISNGALGARLTGAGFGGCAVALVKDSDIDAFIKDVSNQYYNGYFKKVHSELPVPSNLENIIFSVKPSLGAQVTLL
ncbi:MAG: galactokinase [Candidatus Latescibacteria bacterium]|nr:galactokinase [Candidatus Latescibacterota bacterium]